MWYIVTAFAAFVLGLAVAALCGMAGHADHQADLHEAYDAGYAAGQGAPDCVLARNVALRDRDVYG